LNGWYLADAVCSIAISIIIVFGSVRLVLESVNVLLEGTPRHIDVMAVERALLHTDGVTGIHDLHIWTISSGIEALSVHINHDESETHSTLLGSIRQMLHDTFGIDHLTVQMETRDNETEALYLCSGGTRCFEP